MGDDDHTLRPWPILKSDQIGDFKVFSLNAIQKKSPRTGMNTVYYVLNTVDWVNTIAITPNQELVMVEQFRHATNTLELELPGGMMDKLEQDPVMAACRELREETGYEGENSREIGSCFANPAILTNRVHTVLVENCIAKYPLQWDLGEDINIRLIPLCEIYDLILKGKIQHSLMITALFYYKLLTDIKK